MEILRAKLTFRRRDISKTVSLFEFEQIYIAVMF